MKPNSSIELNIAELKIGKDSMKLYNLILKQVTLDSVKLHEKMGYAWRSNQNVGLSRLSFIPQPNAKHSLQPLGCRESSRLIVGYLKKMVQIQSVYTFWIYYVGCTLYPWLSMNDVVDT